MTDILESLSLVKGAAVNSSSIFLTLSADELAHNDDTSHAIFVLVEDGQAILLDNKSWWCADVAFEAGTNKKFAIGEYGEVVVFADGNSVDETISGPDNRGPLRGARFIGSDLYVVGGDRQIYRRDSSGNWNDIGGGLPNAAQGDASVAFEAVDGFGKDEIYACGWAGEVWYLKENEWRLCSIPTNLIISDIVCTEDNQVYACGQAGLVLKGKSDQWSLIDSGGVTTDFWSVGFINNEVYVASMDGLYKVSGNEISLDRQAVNSARSFYDLSGTSDALWSIGAKDLMVFDGQTWEVIKI